MFKTPFKPIGYYVFNYKPLYYDEKKERLKALENRYRKSADEDEEDYEISLSKSNLKNEWCRTRSGSTTDRKSTYRLALIIAILSSIALYILR